MDGVIEVRGGRVRGVHRHDLWSFSGIPYAASPAGPARFRPPAPPEPWTGIRPADRFGPIAPQNPSLIDVSLGGKPEPQSEDCLSLNVWTPGLDGDRRPVMVWIHGGSFVWGSGSGGLYRGGTLARDGDVVVVTVNYRLGLLGLPGPPGPGRAGPVVAGRRALDRVRQLGTGRPGGRPAVGARPHRRLRRRPGQRHPVRRVGRRDERGRPAGRAGGPGTVPPGHRGERRPLRLHPRPGRLDGRAAGRPPRGAHDPAGLRAGAGRTTWCGRWSSSTSGAAGAATAACSCCRWSTAGCCSCPPRWPWPPARPAEVPLLIGTTRDEMAFFTIGEPGAQRRWTTTACATGCGGSPPTPRPRTPSWPPSPRPAWPAASR